MSTDPAPVLNAEEAALRAAHRLCQAEVRQQAGNFYYAFRLLPVGKRQALHAVYCFCRRADDIADGDGTPEQRRIGLEHFRSQLAATLAGQPPDERWLALGDAQRRFALEPARLHEVIDGCAADCAPLEIRTEADLDTYCYGVAGAVGRLSAQIFGYKDSRVAELAVVLGRAMQRTNILRDLREDWQRGRCYLPTSELEGLHLEPNDLARGPNGPKGPAYVELMRSQIAKARRDFAEGRRLVPLVQRNARGCPAALAALYTALLAQIELAGYDVQTKRVHLSAPAKLRLALGAWVKATLH